MPDPTLIIALDFHDARTALDFADRLNPDECRLKVGMELYTAAGPELIDTLARRGFDIFLDLKFHDIPNTVAAAVRVATGLGVWMVNVHALGGRRMLEAARDAVETSGSRTKLVAVTLLTSMNAEALAQLGWVNGFNESVLMLARLSAECGLDGVVCSALEAPALRQAMGQGFCLVTPGIRPSGYSSDDQSRIVTPMEAKRLGADYLVIGRPITRADNPGQVLQKILGELKA